jgi:hypothetical protein
MHYKVFYNPENQSGELGAGAIYADCIVQMTWYSGTPNANAIKNYFTGRGFRVEFSDLHQLTGKKEYLINVRFIASQRAAANLSTIRKAFLDYMATKGNLLYADVHFVGDDGQPQYMSAPASNNAGNQKPSKTSVGMPNANNPNPNPNNSNSYQQYLPMLAIGIAAIFLLKR